MKQAGVKWREDRSRAEGTGERPTETEHLTAEQVQT